MGMPAALQGGGLVPLIIAIFGAVCCLVGALCVWATDQTLWNVEFSWAVVAVIGFCVMNFLCFFLRSSSPGAIILGLMPAAAFVVAFPYFIRQAQFADAQGKLYASIGDTKHRDQARTLCAGCVLTIIGALFTFALVPSWGTPSNLVASMKKAIFSIDFILSVIGFCLILLGSIIGWSYDYAELMALWVAVSGLILQITGDPNYQFTDTLAGLLAFTYWTSGHALSAIGSSANDAVRKSRADFFCCFIGLMLFVIAGILRGLIPGKLSLKGGGGGGDGGKVAPATETA